MCHRMCWKNILRFFRMVKRNISIRRVNFKYWLVLHIWNEENVVVVNVVMFVNKIRFLLILFTSKLLVYSSVHMVIWTLKLILINLEKHSIHRFMNKQHQKRRDMDRVRFIAAIFSLPCRCKTEMDHRENIPSISYFESYFIE